MNLFTSSKANFTTQLFELVKMSNPFDLAGVIGTWVAVFLALVALLGLLPAYLLYKRSRSENAAAIAAINDPHHTFVSGIRVFGVLLAHKLEIPDLRTPPPLFALECATLDKISNAYQLGHTKSKTAWIEFAQLMTAVFPDLELGGKDLLSIKNGETRLPVHKTWLLALGILHRYSLRLDHGLPLQAAEEADPNGALIPEARLSGLSGYLDYQKQDIRFIEDRYEGGSVVSFRMHDLSTIQDSLVPDHLSFLSLALLFGGRVMRGQGTLLRGRIASQEAQSNFPSRPVQHVIASVKEKVLHEGYLQVLPGINVQAKRELSIEIGSVPVEIEKDRRPEEAIESVWHRNGFRRLGKRSHLEIWILKKDVLDFSLGYLEQKPSRYGFLFDANLDLVVSEMMRTNAVETILHLASTWCEKVPGEILAGELRSKIQRGLQGLSHNDLVANRWSRRVMQAIVSLDEALDEMITHSSMGADEKVIVWESMRAMYSCDEDFQQSLNQYLSGLRLEDGDISQARIFLDIEGGTIKFLGDNRSEFNLDFHQMFPETSMSQKPSGGIIATTPVIAMFACLQGQLRATAWKMSLSPNHLGTMCNAMGDICYVTANAFHHSLPLSSDTLGRSGDWDSGRKHDVEVLAQHHQIPVYRGQIPVFRQDNSHLGQIPLFGQDNSQFSHQGPTFIDNRILRDTHRGT